jgi:hypothetical protein
MSVEVTFSSNRVLNFSSAYSSLAHQLKSVFAFYEPDSVNFFDIIYCVTLMTCGTIWWDAHLQLRSHSSEFSIWAPRQSVELFLLSPHMCSIRPSGRRQLPCGWNLIPWEVAGYRHRTLQFHKTRIPVYGGFLFASITEQQLSEYKMAAVRLILISVQITHLFVDKEVTRRVTPPSDLSLQAVTHSDCKSAGQKQGQLNLCLQLLFCHAS